MIYPSTWKDKTLDYEIETNRYMQRILGDYRFSWKDKILDYEIETSKNTDATLSMFKLEKIRFSITRLKLTWLPTGAWHFQATWKDKILDYEIETDAWADANAPESAWKDKILDYEIETRM